jgi:hypothetical protein
MGTGSSALTTSSQKGRRGHSGEGDSLERSREAGGPQFFPRNLSQPLAIAAELSTSTDGTILLIISSDKFDLLISDRQEKKAVTYNPDLRRRIYSRRRLWIVVVD